MVNKLTILLLILSVMSIKILIRGFARVFKERKGITVDLGWGNKVALNNYRKFTPDNAYRVL